MDPVRIFSVIRYLGETVLSRLSEDAQTTVRSYAKNDSDKGILKEGAEAYGSPLSPRSTGEA